MTTRYAKLGEEFFFYWVHPGFDPALTDLTLDIYDEADQLVDSISADAVPTPMGTYVTSRVWLAASLGRYTMNWVSVLGTIDVTETLLVTTHPTGNEEVTVPTSPFVDGLSTGLGDVELFVYRPDEDGALVLWGASPYVTTESTQFPGRYETDDQITFGEEGYYVLYWQSAGTPAEKAVEIIYVGREMGVWDVAVYVVDHTKDPNEFIDQVTVLVSVGDPLPVDQKVTGTDGKVTFSLKENVEYVFSVRKDGYTFDRNNIRFTPPDPRTEEVPAAANTVFIFTGVFQPTFDPEEKIDYAQLSKMYVRVVNMQGLPINEYILLISNNYSVLTRTVGTTEYAVLGGPIELKTNENGYAETWLVRGMEIEVAFEGTPVRRTITVPDQPSFELTGLVTAAGDPFDISEPNIPTMIRRS